MNKTTFTRAKRGFTLSLKEYSLSTKKGFTLIELLVVVAIIGVLATVVLGSISSARAKARDAQRVSDIKTIQTALELYYLDNGFYPKVNWAGSHLGGNTSAWTILGTRLGVTLPVDPTNASNSNPKAHDATFGEYVYSYLGVDNPIYCSSQAYLLVFNLEGKNGDGANDGVTLCPAEFTYGNAFVVGVGADG